MIVTSLLYAKHLELKFVFIDPKMVGFPTNLIDYLAVLRTRDS